jgi:hypothetical protein
MPLPAALSQAWLRRALVAAAVVGMLPVVTSCGLQFRNDHRLSFITPRENQKVSVPFPVRWRMSDFLVTGLRQGPTTSRTGYFALFVDRTPIKPGQTIAAVNADDPSCHDTRACLTPSYLAEKGVYTTTKTAVRLTEVADLSNHESEQYHTATVVLMNTAGRRIGESAWSVEFKMHVGESS